MQNDPVSIARASYDACVRKDHAAIEGSNVDGGRFRNTEILTVRNRQIAEAEVYFGWSIPRQAPAGGFTDA